MKLVLPSAALGLALLGATGATATTAAPPPKAAPATTTVSCTMTKAKVEVDWLRVHTQADINSAVVGQIPGGNYWHYCSGAGHWNGGYFWIPGYGYNGGVKLSGWVDGEYLNYGP